MSSLLSVKSCILSSKTYSAEFFGKCIVRKCRYSAKMHFLRFFSEGSWQLLWKLNPIRTLEIQPNGCFIKWNQIYTGKVTNRNNQNFLDKGSLDKTELFYDTKNILAEIWGPISSSLYFAPTNFKFFKILANFYPRETFFGISSPLFQSDIA